MTGHERQRIRELLEAARLVGGDALKQKVWELLPYKTRFDFNWERTDVPPPR